ncbi:unnamed protein product [Rhizophagus irregularis]|nr:unnamed protein product [Rhizophagus irregularis]
MNDYRAVIGINLGTTHSSFAYSFMNPSNICIHKEWRDGIGYKIPTVLYYDDEYRNVTIGRNGHDRNPVELFKLLLGKMENEPPLQHGKAIIDYFREFGKIVKRTIQHVDFDQALIVLTVPDNNTMLTRSFFTMREYAFKAGLLRYPLSQNFRLTTESKAIALYCMKYLREHNLSVGEKFIVVDCGDNTVYLSTMLLWNNEKLCLISERIEIDCGGDLADQEFLKFIERKIGSSRMNLISENKLQEIKNIFGSIKLSFTGIQSEFVTINFDSGFALRQLFYRNDNNNRWNFKLEFEDVKAIIDPIVERIVQLVDSQLRLCDNCFAISLVGDFGRSKYLQLRIEEKFSTRVLVSRPPNSCTAILRGAVLQGLNYANSDQAYIIKLEEENKKAQEFNNLLHEKYDGLQEKYDNLQEIEIKYVNQIRINQQYKNDIILKDQSEKQRQNNYRLLYDDLQKNYDDLTKKYNEEINQNQIIDENRQYQNNIELQEQRINQLQQFLELKENKLQNLEKEKEELNAENDNLHQKNTNLANQLENILQQNTILKDDVSNIVSNENIDQNYIISLNNDISELNDNLKKYVTDLNQDVIVNMEEIKKLLLLYKCPIKITNQKDDQLLIQAVLQRHIIETILSYATKYFQSTGQHYHLEANIVNKASLLSILLTNISKYRTGNDEIAHVATTKLRQHIYSILNNRGFANIYGEDHITYEHPFIAYHKEELNKTMSELRIVKGQEKLASENLAAIIICEV